MSAVTRKPLKKTNTSMGHSVYSNRCQTTVSARASDKYSTRTSQVTQLVDTKTIQPSCHCISTLTHKAGCFHCYYCCLPAVSHFLVTILHSGRALADDYGFLLSTRTSNFNNDPDCDNKRPVLCAKSGTNWATQN